MKYFNNPYIFKSAIIAAITALYFALGFYSLLSGQEAVVQRFGKDVRHKNTPGVGYHLPFPFEKIIKTNVRQVKTVTVGDSRGKGIECFSGDENLIIIKAVVNYDVKNTHDYLFNIADREILLSSITQKCLCNEVSKLHTDDIMTTGKQVLRLAIKNSVQEKLDLLKAGIRIISIEFTDVTPPQNVSQAFTQVSDAREKKQRIIKEAEGYANTIVPQARGEAVSVTSAAEARRQEIVNRARAEAESFDALSNQYNKNPALTTKITYLQYLQKIYSRCSVTIDANPKNSVYYLKPGGDMVRLDSTLNKLH